MSDLKPKGVKVMLDGVEREFLFTLNAIDEIQSKYNAPVLDVMQDIAESEKMADIVRSVTSILLTDEAERAKWKDPDSKLPPVTEKEAGWLVSIDNIGEVTGAIFKAYGISMPDADDETDPNRNSSPRS